MKSQNSTNDTNVVEPATKKVKEEVSIVRLDVYRYAQELCQAAILLGHKSVSVTDTYKHLLECFDGPGFQK